jgi:hypothetical protein
LKEDRETVLVIAHEASRTGAPILAWNLVKRLNVQYNVVVLLKRGGELFPAFEGQAVAVVRLPDGVENQPDKVYGLVERLVSAFRLKYAIANSVETRLFIGALEENHVPVIALVHEFAEYTGPVGTLDAVYEAASTVVFPAGIVAGSSLAQYPTLAVRGFKVVPQGLCASMRPRRRHRGNRDIGREDPRESHRFNEAPASSPGKWRASGMWALS